MGFESGINRFGFKDFSGFVVLIVLFVYSLDGLGSQNKEIGGMVCRKFGAAG